MKSLPSYLYIAVMRNEKTGEEEYNYGTVRDSAISTRVLGEEDNYTHAWPDSICDRVTTLVPGISH